MGVNGARAHGAHALGATWLDWVAVSGTRVGAERVQFAGALLLCVFLAGMLLLCVIFYFPSHPTPVFSQGRCLSLPSTALSLPIT